MQVESAMTNSCEFIHPDATLREAAQKMRALDCGFLPIGDDSRGKLEGVVTDRDIVVRAVADGSDPNQIPVRSVETQRVLYCFESDDLETAARRMREEQVYRLIVLDNPDSKQLCGVISLGDVLRHNEKTLAADIACDIAAKAA